MYEIVQTTLVNHNYTAHEMSLTQHTLKIMNPCSRTRKKQCLVLLRNMFFKLPMLLLYSRLCTLLHSGWPRNNGDVYLKAYVTWWWTAAVEQST